MLRLWYNFILIWKCEIRNIFSKSFFSVWKTTHPLEYLNMTTFATIMDKLKASHLYPMFVRHKNGNTQDNRAVNLEFVELRAAFKNLDWSVDWVRYLTEEEILFIKNMLTWKSAKYVFVTRRVWFNVFNVASLYFEPAHLLRVEKHFGRPSTPWWLITFVDVVPHPGLSVFLPLGVL